MILQVWPAVAVAVAVTRHGLYAIDRLRQPHARLRGADGAAGRHLRARRAARRPRRRRLGAVGVARDDRRGARVPAAARPRSRRSSTAASRRARFDAVRLLRDFLDEVRDGHAEPEDVGAVVALALGDPQRRGRVPAARDRRLRRTATAASIELARRRPRAVGDRSRRRELGVLLHAPGAAAGPAARACSTPRPCRSSSHGCASSCGCSWPRSSPRARGSPRRATRSGGGSSATCTTARSSGSSRSGSCCAGCSARCRARRDARSRRSTPPSTRSPPRSPTCARSPPACGRRGSTKGSPPRSPTSPAAPPCRSRSAATAGPRAAGGRGRRLLRRLRGAHQRGQARVADARGASRPRARTACCGCRSPTTASAAPRPAAGWACRACRPRRRAGRDARDREPARARARGSRCELPCGS